MTWYVENGRVIEGPLAPFYAHADLHAGMKVQIVPESGPCKLRRATIERTHSVSTNGQQGTIYRERCTSNDDGLVTKDCVTGRPCVHVYYRNGVRSVVDMWSIRPLDSVVDQLAKVAVSADDA